MTNKGGLWEACPVAKSSVVLVTVPFLLGLGQALQAQFLPWLTRQAS